MAGHYKFAMDGKDMVRSLTLTIGSFIQDRLIDKEQRIHQKEQCAERLAAEDGSGDKNAEVRYSDQAVLANLDWGIDALEEAINTSNIETKLARLDYAEKMLQVCAMLDSHHKTAGVPNFYLSAWAHLNLAFLWNLRNNVHNSVHHILEMFMIDPFFSRIDFAPELWETLFLPHMNSIVGWYSETRHKIVIDVMPDSTDLSFTADFDQFFNESLIFSMRPDQAERLQKLEKLYGESLDENTRLYAKYYKECMNFDSTVSKKGMPMVPIAEPPMTPLHEVSRSVPDYVKFGPILPKSSGFSPVLKDKDVERTNRRLFVGILKSRLSVSSISTHKMLEPPKLAANIMLEEVFLEENEDEFDFDYGNVDMDTEVPMKKLLALNSMKSFEGAGSGSKVQQLKKDNSFSPKTLSPLYSPHTPPNALSPKLEINCKKEPEHILRLLSRRLANPSMPISLPNSLPVSPRLCNDSSISSADSDGEVLEVQKNCRKNFNSTQSMSFGGSKNQVSANGFPSGSEEEVTQSSISLPSSEKLTTRARSSKDFVCPITGQLFSDPVTLETGQTYERKAIQEWIKRGNTTCPITRQPLSATILPKTNYVLKRLITSWKEQYPDLAQEFSYSETPRTPLSPARSREMHSESTQPKTFTLPVSNTTNNAFKGNKTSKRFMRAAVSTSPTSVISQAAVETIINGLKPYTSCLCTSEDLKECEAAVLKVASILKESKADSTIHAHLAKPAIMNGLVEILMAESADRELLRTLIYILSELIFADESLIDTLTSVGSDFDHLASLLKNGLAEAAVLIYQLRPAFSQLLVHDLVPSLVQVIISKVKELDEFQLVMEPKDAAISLLDQILLGGDENSKSINALNVISANGLPALIKCLDHVERRISVISILLSCMRADRSCTNLIASRAELTPVLELFHSGDDNARGVCIDFISELVRLNRRTFCNQILQIIKDEGAFSTMHTFLVYLQMAPMEKQPSVASLLLQLDLLVEPRKMSIYREEAIEVLIEALRKKDFPFCQTKALEAFASLLGHLTATGKSLTEAWLLKTAGFHQPYSNLTNAEKTQNEDDELMGTTEEDNVARLWEKRVAFVLCNHENGSIFRALEECLKSNSLEMAKSCLVVATWLMHMLSDLPETGVRNIARQCLLDQFINILQSSKSLEEKVLSAVALKSFFGDPDALRDLGTYAKSICKPLRKLKRNSAVVADTLRALMSLPSVNAMELWSCTEGVEVDSSANGEVLSLAYLKGRLFSCHSDGHVKVWDSGKRVLRLIQEIREHTKAVTCMFIPSSGDKLYTGSLDKTIRVWAIEPDKIHCVEVHDMKEAIHCLTSNGSLVCFTSQGTGAKVCNWGGIPKHININKNVKCLAMSEESLYCGCTGYSIQEVDLSKCTSSMFFSGARKLLGKQTIHALSIHDGQLFASGSSVDGVAGKIFSLSTREAVGSLMTGFDIHCIAVNNDFIFTGTKCGIIEVWLRERITRVASLKVHGGGNTKVTSLVSDSDGEMLFAAKSDGKIQAWALD